MSPVTEGPPSANPGPNDGPEAESADLTRICWTQWLREQDAGQASDGPPRVLPPPGPGDDARLRRLLGED